MRYAMIKRTGIHIIWQADESILIHAGKIKASHHLSFADATIAAYALKHDLVLVHKDPEYKALSSQLDMETLPHKICADSQSRNTKYTKHTNSNT
jgi:hypothetical protein